MIQKHTRRVTCRLAALFNRQLMNINEVRILLNIHIVVPRTEDEYLAVTIHLKSDCVNDLAIICAVQKVQQPQVIAVSQRPSIEDELVMVQFVQLDQKVPISIYIIIPNRGKFSIYPHAIEKCHQMIFEDLNLYISILKALMIRQYLTVLLFIWLILQILTRESRMCFSVL